MNDYLTLDEVEVSGKKVLVRSDLNVPLDELEDLRDRLRHFVRSAGPTQLRAA